MANLFNNMHFDAINFFEGIEPKEWTRQVSIGFSSLSSLSTHPIFHLRHPLPNPGRELYKLSLAEYGAVCLCSKRDTLREYFCEKSDLIFNFFFIKKR